MTLQTTPHPQSLHLHTPYTSTHPLLLYTSTYSPPLLLNTPTPLHPTPLNTYPSTPLHLHIPLLFYTPTSPHPYSSTPPIPPTPPLTRCSNNKITWYLYRDDSTDSESIIYSISSRYEQNTLHNEPYKNVCRLLQIVLCLLLRILNNGVSFHV